MCGIIGYVGFRKVLPLLIDGLKKLEYRGYDSAGVSFKINNNKGIGSLDVVKSKGHVSVLESNIKNNKFFSDVNVCVGLGHTRWATHGIPNDVNAHPHLNKDFSISIVHNGIIENYLALKDLLIGKGFIFVSDTDSEVLVHLISSFYKDDLLSAVRKALRLVEGTYGLAVMSKYSDELVVARKGSPLVIGIGIKEMFVSSDVTALISYTNKVIYLQDGQVAKLSCNDYLITDIDGVNSNHIIEEIKWTLDSIEKKGFKHFMLKEIFEQPDAVMNTLRGRLVDGKVKLSVDIDPGNVERIVLLGCGTSWHACLIAKHYFESLCGIKTLVDYASEFRYRDPLVNDKDLVIVVSQSGETADTLHALREAKKKGAKVCGVVNVVGSSISREVDYGVFIHAGPEIGVASTKAFSCQVVSLLLLALFIRQKKGLSLDSFLLEDLLNLPSIIKRTLESVDVKDLSLKLMNNSNFLYLGRGLSFPVALEGALKLKEISYIHAEGYPAAELKHGPIALIDKHMPVLFISPVDSLFEKVFSNMQEVKARLGFIVCVTDNVDAVKIVSDEIIVIPRVHDLLLPIIANIPLQLLAYHIADSKGLNVDKPRNLAKSVTVE